jgi:gamma-glutamyl hercynylcysteine S-oxide hydrolase
VCRHLAYLGPPTTLAALLLDPPHGLLHQSYAPADMRGDVAVNADGFGAGWYPPAAVQRLVGATAAEAAPGAAPHGEPHADPALAVAHGGPPVQPARYRSDRPIWADTSFAALAAVTPGTGVLGSVRSATPGMPVTTAAAAPFAEGRWLFSHNGAVPGWPASMAGPAAGLPIADLVTLDAPTDAALLWALVRHRLRAGDDPAAVLAGVVLAVDEAAPGSRLNLLLTDGTAIWATTWTHALSVRASVGAITVASEPTDAGPGWTPVPDRHLVVATPERCDVRALEAAARAA